MKKKHIAFLISDMGAGGAQRVASLLCSHWANNENSVTLITFEQDDAQSFHALPDAVRYIKLNRLGSSASVKDAITSNARRVKSVRRTLKEIKPDIVVAFMPENNIITTLAALGLRQCPVVISERSDPRHLPASRIWRALRRVIYPLADSLICQTPKAAEFFDYIRAPRVLYNPTAKPLTDEQPDIILPKKFIGALGRLGPEKGFDLLLRAFAPLADKHQDTDLLIIGEGESRESLKNLAKELGIENRVHLIGQHRAPFTILKKCSAFVMSSRFEGFPNALCEAMVCGLPSIASKGAAQSIPLMEEGKNILLFDTENSDQLREKIDHLLTYPDNAQKLGEQAAHIYEALSSDHICAEWDAHLEQIMDKKS